MHIFVKISWIGIKCIFYECSKNYLKHFAEKSHSVFEGLKGGPFEHTKTFFLQNVFNCFLKIHKKLILYQFNTFFHKKDAGNKKERNYWPQGLQIVAFLQLFPNVNENALSKKKYLNLECECECETFPQAPILFCLTPPEEVVLIVWQGGSNCLTKWF